MRDTNKIRYLRRIGKRIMEQTDNVVLIYNLFQPVKKYYYVYIYNPTKNNFMITNEYNYVNNFYTYKEAKKLFDEIDNNYDKYLKQHKCYLESKYGNKYKKS